MFEAKTAPVNQGIGALVNETSLWLLFALLGGSGASVLALGMLLRSSQALSRRVVIGTVMHSLAWGVAVYALAYDSFKTQTPFLLGLSITSGMGAASFLDLVMLLIKQRMGISISFNPPSKEPSHGPADQPSTDR